MSIAEAIIARLLETGAFDADDIAAIAATLEGEGSDDDAHIVRALLLEASAKGLTIADIRRAQMKVVDKP